MAGKRCSKSCGRCREIEGLTPMLQTLYRVPHHPSVGAHDMSEYPTPNTQRLTPAPYVPCRGAVRP